MNSELRYFLYDFFFSMFVREPADEIIGNWRKGLAVARDAEPDDPVVAATESLRELLEKDSADEAARDEFVRLFWNPGEPLVSLLASTYVDGKPYGKYLVRFRSFIAKTPFRKTDDYREPEDSLPFHLDLMRSFISEGDKAECPQAKADWRKLECELVNDFLAEWADQAMSKLAKRDSEPIYQQAAVVLWEFFRREHETSSYLH